MFIDVLAKKCSVDVYYTKEWKLPQETVYDKNAKQDNRRGRN